MIVASQADDRVLTEFGDAVLRAGYDSPATARAVRLGKLIGPTASSPPASCGPLLELLALGRPVPREALEPGLRVGELVQAGVLELHGEDVRSRFRAEVLDGLLVLGDDLHQAHPDAVAAVYQPSRLLARLTPRSPRHSMLDLGSGSGVQALLAARHCEEVVAVDINPRALELGRLNACVNGVDDVDWRLGSWLEPVAGERFDLIACNPPYVISPDAEFVYRDSGMAPGALIEHLIGELPAHLEDGGVAIMIAMWPHSGAEDWEDRPRRWAAQSGCDTVVICWETGDPVEQAVRWNSPPSRLLDPAAYTETMERWYRFYEEHGIGSVSFGAVVLRRRSGGTPWSVVSRVAGSPGPQAAGQIERIIAGNDRLGQAGGLLAGRYRVPDGLSITQRFVRRDGQWVGRMAAAAIPEGLGLKADVVPAALDAVFQCTGAARLDEALTPGADRPVVEEAVRTLLRHGLLEAVSA